jgi:hypothetical protein
MYSHPPIYSRKIARPNTIKPGNNPVPSILEAAPVLLAEAAAVVLSGTEDGATACVVTTVLVIAGTVDASLVVPETVLGCAVDISVVVTKLVDTLAVVPISVETVCETVTTLENVDPGIVVGNTVVASTTLAGNVVVNVSVTNAPSELTGTAPPTPVPVNCGGRAKIAVFGFAASLPAYIFPLAPPDKV